MDIRVESVAMYLNYRGNGYGPYFTIDGIESKINDLCHKDSDKYGKGVIHYLKNVVIINKRMVRFERPTTDGTEGQK